MKPEDSQAATEQADTHAENEPEQGAPADEQGHTEDEGVLADQYQAAPAAKPKKAKGSKKRKRHAPEPSDAPADPTGRKPTNVTRWALVALAAALIVGVAVYFIARRSGKPRWKVGKEVPVEITLVAADKTNLACASTEEIAGKHCAFEAPKKPSTKGPALDDRAVLKPYTTTDHRNLVAVGLWGEPALADAPRVGRFSVKCTFVIEGVMKQLSVRWTPGGPWSDTLPDWYAGTVKGCTLLAPSAASAAPVASAAPAASSAP